MRRHLILALLSCALGPPASAETTLLGQFIWEAEGVGGVSGLEVDSGGDRFIAVSDRGAFYLGVFTRDGEGRIDGVEGGAARMLGPRGQPVTNAEAIAVTRDGVLVGFEGRPRLYLYGALDEAPAVPVQLPRELNAYPRNRALEALAAMPDGALYVLLETPADDGTFPVFHHDGTRWSIAFSIAPEERFLPTGADIGPDGRLYIVERDSTGPVFRSQIRRFALDGSGEERLLRHPPGAHDNLEAISVWADASGAIRLTLVSDDNFRALQRTEILEYRLDE